MKFSLPKKLLDVVDFSMLRVENHSIALELYHRLKEGESNFQILSSSYAVGPDRNKNPLCTNQRIGAPRGSASNSSFNEQRSAQQTS